MTLDTTDDTLGTTLRELSLPPSLPVIAEQFTSTLDALAAAIGEGALSRCSDTEVVTLAETLERGNRRIEPAVNQVLVELSDRDLPRKLGFRSVMAFMTTRLRITGPRKRLHRMTMTAQFHTATGEPKPLPAPTLAAAATRGDLTPTHLDAALEALDKLPHNLPHDQRVAAERLLGEHAPRLTPAEITAAGERLLAHLDPDGELADDADRQRRRGVWVNRQDLAKMSKLNGHIKPLTRARLEVVFATWGAPGMNDPSNPDSPSGSVDGADPDAVKAARERDDRTPAQRNHDALSAFLTAGLDAGILGKSHRGLPPQLIIKADLTDLLTGTGTAATATGTRLPINDVIALTDTATAFLSVFTAATAIPLYFGRLKRLATTGQRLASFAAPGGETCSHPDCTAPAAHVEMHHAVHDWADGGHTDITELAPACPQHNRMVGEGRGRYTTGKYLDGPDAGRTWWQLNTEPGMPENPKRINRVPDLLALLNAHLARARAEIHGTPPVTPNTTAPTDDRQPPTESATPATQPAPSDPPPPQPAPRIHTHRGRLRSRHPRPRRPRAWLLTERPPRRPSTPHPARAVALTRRLWPWPWRHSSPK
ncbi:MAG: DUF222 domain-containing protein [Gordonia sp. (in: high G+C Gram-positive bacteria)]